MLLETRGYEVDIANSGKEAFEIISSKIDLVILDLTLPDQNGFDICRKFKEQDKTRKIPIVILSAKLMCGDIVEGLYLGADDYLTKPFEYEELVARMEAVMRRAMNYRSYDDPTHGTDYIICELRKIIDEELITPYFQPIFNLEDKHVLGFEALSRPKTASILSNPELLFKAAVQYGFYHDLEVVAWKKALEYAAKNLRDTKLFLNCNPYLVEGPKFLAIKTLFDKAGVDVKNVVLEITERSAITDFKVFYDHLRRYREYGFKFAVDDVGGGYASLESIVETKPEVVKIDRHIVKDLGEDSFKRSIVKFIVAFCRENNIVSIAEGIETKEELEQVKSLGVTAGQGYYLSRPAAEAKYLEMQQLAKTF
jgi:EAL domain-containing protein (putative c-di-GMP-specific phosphodiesterase class I)